MKPLLTRPPRSGHRTFAEYGLETWDNDSELGQLLTVEQPAPPEGQPRSVGLVELANARSLAFEALAHVIAGRADEALRCSSRAADLAPGDVGVLCTRARVLAELGSMEAAEAFARSAVAVDPAGVQPRLHLSRVLVQQRRLDDAEVEAELAKRTDPSHPEALSLLRLIERFRELRLSVDASDPLETTTEPQELAVLSTANAVPWWCAAAFCVALAVSVAYHGVLLAQGHGLTVTMVSRFVLAFPAFGWLTPRLVKQRPF